MSLIIRATHVTLHAEATRLEARRAALQQELASSTRFCPRFVFSWRSWGRSTFPLCLQYLQRRRGNPRDGVHQPGPLRAARARPAERRAIEAHAFAHGAAYVSPSDTNSANTGSDSDNRGRAWPNAFRSWEAGTVDAEEDPS